jgi:hypothetical protein
VGKGVKRRVELIGSIPYGTIRGKNEIGMKVNE